jgi:hypothetical protein
MIDQRRRETLRVRAYRDIMTADTRPVPTIAAEDVMCEDDESLAALVDSFIFGDPDARARQSDTLALQHELRGQVDRDAWATYARLEEVVNARWSELSLVLVRWAFNEGRRAGRRP